MGGSTAETEVHAPEEAISDTESIVIRERDDHKFKIIWRRVIFLAFVHIGGLLGLWLSIGTIQWKTIFYCKLANLTLQLHKRALITTYNTRNILAFNTEVQNVTY